MIFVKTTPLQLWNGQALWKTTPYKEIAVRVVRIA